MSFSLSYTREVAVSAVACIIGALLVPVVPVVGFPMCAAALARLVYSDRATAAAFVGGIAVAIAGVLRLSDVMVLLPGMIAVMVAASSVKRRRALTVSVALVPALAVSFAMGELANAWLLGMSYRDYMAELATLMEPALDRMADAGVSTTEGLVELVVRFAPSGYFALAVLTVIPTMVAIGWAARSSDTRIERLPALSRIDLSPHVVWFPIAALLMMAAGRFMGDAEGLVATVGLNLLFAARIALFVQGIAVIASWLDTLGVKGFGRFVAYVAAFAVDMTTLVVTLVGLIDFWVNLRKLDRPGERRDTGSKPVE